LSDAAHLVVPHQSKVQETLPLFSAQILPAAWWRETNAQTWEYKLGNIFKGHEKKNIYTDMIKNGVFDFKWLVLFNMVE